MSRRHSQRGMTLVEVVVSIVVIGLAGAALVGTLSYLAGTGSKSMLQTQAQSVADAYLNEILGKAFVDPDIDGEASRDLYDDIDDYDGLSGLASDERGNAAGNFQVSVAVVPGTLGGLPAADVRRIDVTVIYGDNDFVIASGYKTRHP